MKVHVVIGSGFGDEGKGSLVNHLSKTSNSKQLLICRLNGGNQAGHTIRTQKGDLHVCSALSAGFEYGKTYWGEEFVFEPKGFIVEWLYAKQYTSTLSVLSSDRVRVTTPFDIIAQHNDPINRANGTVGTGFLTTILRNKTVPLSLYEVVYEKNRKGEKVNLYKKLRQIANFYGLTFDDHKDTISSWLEDIKAIRYLVESKQLSFMYEESLHRLTFDEIICEGAQGLLLDQDNVEGYPHLTPSKTGSHNVARFLKKVGILDDDNISDSVTIRRYYVSRPYMTRHGNGYFPSECDISEWFDVYDSTNKTNEFQGELRKGLLDWKLLHSHIVNDMSTMFSHEDVFALSCVDQMKDSVLRLTDLNGETITLNLYDFFEFRLSNLFDSVMLSSDFKWEIL